MVDDNEIKHVYSMSQSKGWEFVEKFINKNLKALRNEYESGNFENMSEVKELQSKIQVYKKVLNFVKRKEQKYLNKGDN